MDELSLMLLLLSFQLGLGFAIAESKLPTDENVAKLFYKCKDFVVASCQGEVWLEKIDDICQVNFITE